MDYIRKHQKDEPQDAKKYISGRTRISCNTYSADDCIC